MRCGELQLSQRGSGKERRSAGTKRGSEKVCSLAWTVPAGGDHGPREGKARTAHAQGSAGDDAPLQPRGPRTRSPQPGLPRAARRAAGCGRGGSGGQRAPDWSCSAAFVLPLSHLQARARRCSARGRPEMRGTGDAGDREDAQRGGFLLAPHLGETRSDPPKETSPNVAGAVFRRSGGPSAAQPRRSPAPPRGDAAERGEGLLSSARHRAADTNPSQPK